MHNRLYFENKKAGTGHCYVAVPAFFLLASTNNFVQFADKFVLYKILV